MDVPAVVIPRDDSTGAQSFGAASFGAASLGARREAPAPAAQRAPRVRSDERTIATQGDLLNSIKFQRRLCENNLIDEKINKNFHEKFSIPKNKEVITRVVSKWSGNDNNSNTAKIRNRNTPQEKPIPSKSRPSATRSNSPKGRMNVFNPYN